MRAKKEYYINKQRQELGEIVPIDTPFVIYLEPSTFCNLKCDFCSNPLFPQNKRTNLSLELFKKMLNDLNEFDGNVKVISINGNGEPLCNKNIIEMIRLAKQSGKIDKVRLITNGTLLTPKVNSELINAGIDMVWISVEALSAVDYERVAGVRYDIENLAATVKDLFEKKEAAQLYVKIVDVAVKNKTEEQRFYEMFGNICDNILVEHITNIYSDVKSVSDSESLVNRFTGDKLEYFDICDYIFKGISLNANGTCSPCPVDWKGGLILGDLNEASLKEIWDGEILRKYRLDILDGNIKGMPVCKDCCLYLNAQSSIIDIHSLTKHRTEICNRLKKIKTESLI